MIRAMRAISKLARFGVAGLGLMALGLHAQPDPPAPAFINVTVHDPSVVRDGATYYVFGSHMAAASTPDLMSWTQIASSPSSSSLIRNGTPLVEFSAALAYAGNATTFWAPDVIKLGDGKYYCYYCACQGSSPLSALGLAKADAITGAYANVGIMLMSAGSTPTVSPYDVNTMPNVVDPSVFFDQTGKLWMVYGSFSGGIFILQLDSTVGSPAIGQPLPNQGYGKKLIGGNSSRLEGAYIIYSPESAYYYLFMTFGGLDAAGGYNIRVGRSRNPDGPFLDAIGNDLTNVKGNFAFDDATIAPYGVKLMGGYQFLHVAGEPGSTSRGYLSPGGCSVNRDPATGKYFLVFHTRFVGRGEQHEVRVHQMFVNVDGWPVVAPQRYAGETIAATDAGRVVGDYKLINHGKAITATVSTSSTISLLADGSVTGTVPGTWQLMGDYGFTLAFSGVIYRGVFVRQWDDDTQTWVLAFTALSDNGTAIWGSKVAINTLPAILTQPASRTVSAGTSVTFTVLASGDPAPTYQWKKNDVDVTGATDKVYTIAVVQAGDAGAYTVVATNTVNFATSNPATLTVNPANVAPAITLQPVSQTVTAGRPVTFTATASGPPTPTFQWQKNSVNINGATSSSYTIASVLAGDGATYRVVATNAVSSTPSNGAMLTVNAAAGDFNGDGKADLLWQNTATGERLVWLMNGTAFGSSVSLGVVPPGWSIAGSGDFNGDAKNDFLWQDKATGERRIWLMDGTTFSSSVSLGIVPLEWSIAGSGDFNGDGKADILWQNRATGERCIWLMNGTAFGSSVALGVVPTEWSIAGSGDFNGDGKSDILWQNRATGERLIWLMNGTAFGSSVALGVVPTEWSIAGSGDYNGDGKADLLWQNRATGERLVWLMNGTAFGSSVALGVVPSEWMLGGPAFNAAAPDFNSDGKSDLVWQNTTTGERSLWLMAGTAYGSSAFLGVIPVEWSMAGTGDFNGDGKTDLVWQNTTTGERSLWLMDGTGYSSSVSLGVVPTPWKIAGTGDFNGDGKTDLVWQNTTTGERLVWLMNGTAYGSSVFLGMIPVEWSIAAAADFNGDGKTDLVWQNTVTGERSLWLMDGTAYGSSVFLGVIPVEWRIAGTGDFNGDGQPDILWQNTTTGERYLWLMNGTTFSSSVFLGLGPTAWQIVR